jgi:MFS family permease
VLNRSQVRLLLPLSIALALSLTGDSTLYAVLANQVDVVGISLGMVGLLLGANRLIRIPANLLAGSMNDRWPRRPLFLAGLVLGIVSTLSYTVARGLWPMLAGRLLWGVAWSFINVGGYNMILDRSTDADRGRMAGFYQMAFMTGLAISPVLGGALTDALGFRPALFVCAVVSGAGLVVALVALPETRAHAAEPRGTPWAGRQRLRLATLLGVWRHVDRQTVQAGYVYLVTLFVSAGVLVSTIGLYLGERWGTDVTLGSRAIGVASLTGMMLALRAVLGVLAGPPAGLLSDRLHDRWPVVRGAILLGTGGFLILGLSDGVWAVPAGVATVSLAAGALITVLAALVGDRARGKRQGVTMGGLATAGDIGAATGPLLAYALVVWLDLRWVYLLCAVVLVSALIATVGHRTTR